jgi:hypothetical protein
MLDLMEFPEAAVGNNDISNERFDTLLSVVSDLGGRDSAAIRCLTLNGQSDHTVH